MSALLPRPELNETWSALMRRLRFPVRLPARLTFGSEVLPGVTRNLSSTGICVGVAMGSSLPPLGSEVSVLCQAPREELPLEIRPGPPP